MNIDALAIESAAKQELQNLRRTSFSSEGFSAEEEDAIAAAIVAAIQAYDEQKQS